MKLSLRVASMLLLLVVLACSLLAFGVLRWYFVAALHDGHMHFPDKPQGRFVSPPYVGSTPNEIYWVTWAGCMNSFQVVTDDYVQDEQPTLWMGGGPECHFLGESGQVECKATLPAEMRDVIDRGRTAWFVALSNGCDVGPKSNISPMLILRK